MNTRRKFVATVYYTNMIYKKALVLLVASVAIKLGNLDVGIFWDSVLFVSRMGNPLYDHGIFNWMAIPDEADPGHPPFLAMYMAWGWTWLGKSLITSHVVMLPFVFGLLWQLHSFVGYFVKDKVLHNWAFLMVVVDPTLMAQLVLISFECIQLFFLFMAINAMLAKKDTLKVLALAILGIVSLRGMMLCAGVFLTEVALSLLRDKRNLRTAMNPHRLLGYFLAALPALSYLAWRWFAKGWIISHPDQLWGQAWGFESVSDVIYNFGRNLLVFGFQIQDFGRVVPLLIIVLTLILRRRDFFDAQTKTLIVVMTFCSSLVVMVSLCIDNTMGHRYFISIYIGLLLLAFIQMQYFVRWRIWYFLVLVSLFSGHLLVYPDDFAQGWDASLAHRPYWQLRREAIQYLDDQQISVEETATFFPNIAPIDDIDLNGDPRSFVPFTGRETHVFYSNVYNLSDGDLDNIGSNYEAIKTFQKRRIRVEILQKKE